MFKKEKSIKTIDPSLPLDHAQHSNAREIDVSVQGVALDYTAAHILAGALAEKAAGETMLVAWFDGKNNAGYPKVQECTGDKPGWLAYAESHSGNLSVNINGGEFIFVYATGDQMMQTTTMGIMSPAFDADGCLIDPAQ